MRHAPDGLPRSAGHVGRSAGLLEEHSIARGPGSAARSASEGAWPRPRVDPARSPSKTFIVPQPEPAERVVDRREPGGEAETALELGLEFGQRDTRVTGKAKGKPITLPTVQVVFRRLCRNALKGDNGALRGVIELMLTLVPVARDRAKEEAEDARIREAARKFDRLMRGDRGKIDGARNEPEPQNGRAGQAARRPGEE
jgi:hypothetical protein